MILAHRSWGNNAGRIALMVHGGRDASSTWKEVGPWLAERGFHAIAVDMRGHGESKLDLATAEASLSAVAQDFVDTIGALRPDARGVDVLIGHSLGGLASFTCVAEHPAFARRLVIEDTPAANFDVIKGSYSTAELIKLARAHPNPAEVLPERTSVRPDQLADKVAAAIATDPDYLPELMRSFATADINALTARSPVPTLVIVGKDFGKEFGKSPGESYKGYSMISGADRINYMAGIKQGTLVEIPSAGHYVHTVAFPEFTKALGDWLDKTA